MRRMRLLGTTLLLVTAPSAHATVTATAPADRVPATAASVPGGFGRAVAIAGDYAFVGEPGSGRGAEPGVVHVYRRQATGWRRVATLRSVAGAPGDGFGTSLATDGATLLVGQTPAAAPRGPGGGAPAGAEPVPSGPETVQRFRRLPDGTWAAAGTLASPFGAGAGFGTALALVGDVALVGAPGEGGMGAVAVFRRSADGAWSAAGRLSPREMDAGDQFGASLTLARDVAAVGAPGREQQRGAVFVFSRGGDGSWTQAGAPLASRRAPDNAQLGASVVLSGDRLIVGAPGAVFAAAGAPAAGAPAGQGAAAAAARGRGAFAGGMGMVVEFRRNPAGAWVEGATVTPYDFPATARLGASLALAGSELWAGAPMADGAGRIYQIRQDSSGALTGMAKLMVNGPATAAGGRFGPGFASAVAVAGGSAIVGMPSDAGGLGTVMFLARQPNGEWVARGTDFPPVADRFASVKGKEVQCGSDGMAGKFPCSNASLLSFLSIQDIGGDRSSRMNDNWGWTDPQTGREYALAGRTDGTAFVDITDPERPRYLGSLPKTPGVPSGVWRDIKTYKNHAYIVADGSGAHGMQVFDLTRLRNVTTPRLFTPDTTYREINSSHNIVINENTGYAYAVGASAGGTTCGGALHMIDIREPKRPKFAGCFQDTRTGRAKTGYSHDAQCVTYKGPDTRYTGREICVGSNETAIAVSDVTDKSKPTALSFISYPNVAYAHQGWFTDDQRYFYVDDESDEIAAQRDTTGTNTAAKGTRTMIYDMSKLDDPVLAKEYIGPVRSSDHNLYVVGNKLYEANYGSGLRIIDITDPVNPKEVAYLDTYPDDENQPVMHGAWSTYPFFRSGTILVTSGTEGLFMVKDRSTKTIP